MSENKRPFLNDELSKKTSIFGLRLWVVLGICVGAGIVLLLFIISLWFTSKRNNKVRNAHTNGTINNNNTSNNIPNISKEIMEIRQENSGDGVISTRGTLPDPVPESENNPNGHQRIHIEIGKDHRISYPERAIGSGSSYSCHGSGEQQNGLLLLVPEVSHLGWGHWYTLRELEESTNGFADQNVIGEGGYGIVYHGILQDNTHVAVKNLLNNRGQAEKEFKVEVEAIGRVRHKNLVRLLGYCAEGAHRILVYEYVDNGNLEQWLHGDVGPLSPLTWEARMNIMIGTAKGYVCFYSFFLKAGHYALTIRMNTNEWP